MEAAGDDAAIANRAREGARGGLSREEFTRELERARRALWVVAAAVLGGRADAEDVVQDAAVIALGQLDRFTPGTSFQAWMGQIVRNVARNRARKQGRAAMTMPEQEPMGATGGAEVRGAVGGGRAWAAGGGFTSGLSGGGDERVESGGRAKEGADGFDGRVARALEAVEETARVCLLLRTVAEMTYTQIAAITGVPETTAMSHVHRARRYLRERLAELDPGRGWRDAARGEGTA